MTTNTGYVGSIAEYNDQESFESYMERFEQFVIVNGVKEEKKVPLFLTVIGHKCYDILRSSLLPEKPASKTYEQLKKVLQDYYAPEKCIIAERYRFHKRVQKLEESITQFAVELKSLARQCVFGNFLDDALRDQFVCGVRDEHTRQKLLIESELTFDKAVKIAVATELAASQVRSMTSGEELTVAKISMKTTQNQASRDNKATPFGEGGKRMCMRCGGSWNQEHREVCRAKEAKCNNCGIIGHYARVCRKKQQRPINAVNKDLQVHHAAAKKEEDECGCVMCVTKINCVHVVDIEHSGLKKNLYVQNRKISFEVDTGAAVTVMSKKDFNKHFKNTIQIENCQDRLKSASDQLLTVVGKTNKVNVTKEDSKQVKYMLSFVIVEENIRIPLLGRDWLDQLCPNWRKEIMQINVEKENHNAVTESLKEFSTVFEENSKDSIEGFEANIVLKDKATPVFRKAYGVPYKIVGEVEEKINEFVEKGLWTPVRYSNWASPLVVVDKKNGGLRLCIDYKGTVNPNIERDMYPLPKLEDILASISGGKVFCTLDLAAAYMQLKLSEGSKQLLVVNTHKGLFAPNRLPFGVSSAPGIFQSVMDTILGKIPGVCCYLDDVIISGQDKNECKERLYTVLSKLKEYKVKVNLEKGSFFKERVEYLGHLIDGAGIRPKGDNIDAILKCDRPNDVTQLKSYLGMLNFHGKFLPNLSTLLSPLYALLKSKVKYDWTDSCEKAFRESKKALKQNKLLTHYDVNSQIYIESDASQHGVGAVLYHIINGEQRPIRFASATLTQAEQNYSQLDREALGIIFAVKKFHKYIYGRKVILVTDNQPLKKILGPKSGIPPLAASRLQRWAIILSQYDYDLQLKSNLRGADMLSRLPTTEGTNDEILQIEIAEPLSNLDIARETVKDPTLSKVLDLVKRGWPSHISDETIKPFFAKRMELSISGDCVCFGNRVVIPVKLRAEVLRLLHEGHPGIVRMKMLARAYVFWPNMNQDIEEEVKRCAECQLLQNTPKSKDLMSWDRPSRIWERVHIDFLDIHDHKILLIVDSYSRWVDAHIMRGTECDKTVSKLLSTFSTLGFPQELVSDNGPPFNANDFAHFCRAHGIRLTHSPPYHAQSNGMAEKAVQVIKLNLKKQLLECKARMTMENKITRFLMFVRNTPCVKTGKAPAELVLKQLPRTKLSMLKPDYYYAKKQVDRKVVDEYEVGQPILVRAIGDKEVKWWPGEIIARKSAVTYLVWANGKERFVHAGDIRKNLTGLRVTQDGENTLPANDNHQRFQEIPLSAALLHPSSNSAHNSDDIQRRRSEGSLEQRKESQQEVSQPSQQDGKEPSGKEHRDPVQLRRSQRQVKKPDRLNL